MPRAVWPGRRRPITLAPPHTANDDWYRTRAAEHRRGLERHWPLVFLALLAAIVFATLSPDRSRPERTAAPSAVAEVGEAGVFGGAAETRIPAPPSDGPDQPASSRDRIQPRSASAPVAHSSSAGDEF